MLGPGLLALLLSGPLAASEGREVAATPPSILLVTVDTLRADHLGVYGYPRPTDPGLQARAAGFTLFEQAFTPLPLTLPAHAAILTGRYPRELGVLNNHHGMPEGPPVLPELLQAADYRSAAVVASSVLSSVTGIARGFEIFDEPELKTGFRRRSAEAVNRVAVRVMESVREPLFLWVHYYDVHSPFDLPDRFYCMMRENETLRRVMEQRGLAGVAYHEVLNAVHTAPLRENGREVRLAEMIARYDASIRYTTSRLVRLLDAWDRTPHGSGSLVILTSDHGEGLGQHGFWSHGGRLFDEALRVPLLIRWPESRGSRAREATGVSLLDLTPTILAVAGTSPGRGRLPGFDLRAVSAGGGRDGAIFTQRMRYLGQRDRASQRDWRPGDGWAVVDGPFKYMRHQGIEAALYDRQSDPLERHNLVARHGRVARRLDALLEHWLQRVRDTRPMSPASESESERLRRLRSLGYVD